MPRTHHDQTPVMEPQPQEPVYYYLPPPPAPRARRSPGMASHFFAGLAGTIGRLLALAIVVFALIIGLGLGGLVLVGSLTHRLQEPTTTTTTTP